MATAMAMGDRLKDAAYRAVKRYPLLRTLGVHLLKWFQRFMMASQRVLSLGRTLPRPTGSVATGAWVAASPSRARGSEPVFQVVSEGRVVLQPAPVTIDPEIHWKFRRELEHRIPTTFVAVIPDGRVWGEGQLITPDNMLLSDVSRDFKDGTYIKHPGEHPLLNGGGLPRPSRLEGTVAVLTVPGGRGYYHWLCDLLPRFHLIRSSTVPAPDSYLVNSVVADFQKESLEALGISRSQVVESMWHPHVTAPRLVVPSLPDDPGFLPTWAIDFLRRTFTTSGPTSSGPRRIYVSRAGATHRRLTNEEELLSRLDTLGFQTVAMESLSLSEKANLMSNCEVIVAPHGAGLTNIVFGRPGAKVVELFSPNAVHRVYWRLACAAGLDYAYVIGKGEVPPEGEDPQANEEDISINPDEVTGALELLGVN